MRCSGPPLVVERRRENLHLNGIFHLVDYFGSMQLWMPMLTTVLQRFPRCRYNWGNDGGRLESRLYRGKPRPSRLQGTHRGHPPRGPHLHIVQPTRDRVGGALYPQLSYLLRHTRPVPLPLPRRLQPPPTYSGVPSPTVPSSVHLHDDPPPRHIPQSTTARPVPTAKYLSADHPRLLSVTGCLSPV